MAGPETTVPAIQALLEAPPIGRFLSQVFGHQPRLLRCVAALRPIPHPPQPAECVTLCVTFDPTAVTTALSAGPVTIWHPSQPIERVATPPFGVNRVIMARYAP